MTPDESDQLKGKDILPEKVKTAVRQLHHFKRLEIGLTAVPKPGAVPSKQTPAPISDVEVFQGQRVCVIRIDEKAFRSDQTNLTPELRHLFSYIEHNGVTPALMEYLRQFGSKVTYKTADLAHASDRDPGLAQHANTQVLAKHIEQNAAQLRSKQKMNDALKVYHAASPLIVALLIGLLALSVYFLLRLF